jgi:hypothetical protein
MGVETIIQVVGTLMQMQAQNAARKKQEAAVNAAQQIADQRAGEARARLLASSEQYKPQARQQEEDAIATALREQFRPTVAASAVAPTTTGYSSKAYEGAISSRTGDSADRANRLNQMFATTIAPGRAAGLMSQRSTAAAEEAGSLFRSGGNAMRAAETDASRIMPNAGLTMLGGLARTSGPAIWEKYKPKPGV